MHIHVQECFACLLCKYYMCRIFSIVLDIAAFHHICSHSIAVHSNMHAISSYIRPVHFCKMLNVSFRFQKRPKSCTSKNVHIQRVVTISLSRTEPSHNRSVSPKASLSLVECHWWPAAAFANELDQSNVWCITAAHSNNFNCPCSNKQQSNREE